MKTLHLPLAPLLLLLLAACLGLGLNSCTNDLPDPEQLLDPNPDPNPDGALRPEDYVGQPVSFSGFTVTEVSTDAATRAVTGSKSEPFGKKGERVTIRMAVTSVDPDNFTEFTTFHFADYVLSPDGASWVPVSDQQDKTLCWQGINDVHHFTAYYPALTGQEKENKGRYKVSLPLTWTEDNYRKCGSLMQSPRTKFDIGSPVSLNLGLLLTRIEVSIDPTTGITDATHLTMYTMTKGAVDEDGIISPSGINNPVQAMNLWRSPSPADATPGTPPDANPLFPGYPKPQTNPVFRGYAIPQTYAPGTLLLKHHTPDVNDARSYTVDLNPNFPNGLTTKGGEVVSFKVAAIVKGKVHVDRKGGLRDALNAAFPAGDYPTRLKITGEVDYYDLMYLIELTSPAGIGGQSVNITAVDMEEVLTTEADFTGIGNRAIPFNYYNGSIKSLVLPSSLSTVPNNAFWGSTLTSVTLPEALTDVGDNAFQYCADLQQVALPGNNPITVGTDAFKDIHPSCHLFLYAPGLDASGTSIQEYLSATWGGTVWQNVHWGYKGSGSKLNPANYEHHLKVMP